MSGQRMIIMNAGSSYFEHVENYYGSNACEQHSYRNGEMPEELKTEKAQKIMQNLMDIGVVTEDFMPLGISTSEAAVLAYQMVVKESLTQAFKELREAEASGAELPDARNLFK